MKKFEKLAPTNARWHTAPNYRRWVKQSTHRQMRRDWKRRGEDAGTCVRHYTRGWEL